MENYKENLFLEVKKMYYSEHSPSRSSLEYQRRRKPENNSGCGCCQQKSSCDSLSLALENSPLDLWQKKYGKLQTIVTFKQDQFGKQIQFVEKKICPISKNSLKKDCFLRHKIYS